MNNFFRLIAILIFIVAVFIPRSSLFAMDKDFENKLNSLRWVAYAPTNFNPKKGLFPSDESIKEDLKVLVNSGFQGIVTYGADGTLGEIPKIARGSGFKGVIMGIWDLNSREEFNNAVKMAPYVDGYCVGNEGLDARYGLEKLKAVMLDIKTKTGRAVTTTEEIFDYGKQYVCELGDWIFPNAHPFLAETKVPSGGVRWLKQYYKILKHNSCGGKPVLFKEVGYPTKGDRLASEKNQKEFFTLMEFTDVKFVYFEAFDQNWKVHLPVEPHWGLFDKNRKPKKFVLLKIKK